MTAPYPVFKLPEFTGFSERQWQKSCSSDGAINRVKNFSFECTNETRSKEPLVS